MHYGFLVYISYYNINNNSISVIGQLITIPVIIFTILSFIFGLFQFYKKQWDYIPNTIVNFITIIIMIYFTIIQS